MGKADVGGSHTHRDGQRKEWEQENPALARAKAAAARRRLRRLRERAARVADRRAAERELHRERREQQETVLTARFPHTRRRRGEARPHLLAPAHPQTITERYGRCGGVLGAKANETETEERKNERGGCWYGTCSAALLALGAAVGHAVLGAAAQDLVKAARDVVVGQAS